MTEQTGNNKPNEAEGLAFPLSGNEKLIEEALVAYWGGAMNAHVHGSVAGMRAAFAVFEKALTPTDDEREDMIAFLLRDHNFEESPWGRTYTDAEIANALRRSELQEPSDEQWCGGIHICSNAEHDHQEPQGEPSDAQLLAALTAYEAKAREQGSFPAMATPLNLTWFSDASADRMRAALRAGGVR